MKPQTEPSNIENKNTIPNTDSAMDINDSNVLQHNHSDANKKVCEFCNFLLNLRFDKCKS